MTVKVLKPRRRLSEGDFKRRASAMTEAPLPVDGWRVPARSLARHHLPALLTDPFPSDERAVATVNWFVIDRGLVPWIRTHGQENTDRGYPLGMLNSCASNVAVVIFTTDSARVTSPA